MCIRASMLLSNYLMSVADYLKLIEQKGRQVDIVHDKLIAANNLLAAERKELTHDKETKEDSLQ